MFEPTALLRAQGSHALVELALAERGDIVIFGNVLPGVAQQLGQLLLHAGDAAPFEGVLLHEASGPGHRGLTRQAIRDFGWLRGRIRACETAKATLLERSFVRLSSSFVFVCLPVPCVSWSVVFVSLCFSLVFPVFCLRLSSFVFSFPVFCLVCLRLSFLKHAFPHLILRFVFCGLREFKILKGEVSALRMRIAF